MTMIEKLQKLKEEALESLSKVKDLNSFREIEVKYLGRKGDRLIFCVAFLNWVMKKKEGW